MDIQSFVQLTAVGSILSVSIEYIQEKFKVNSRKTKTLVIALSILLGTLYWILQSTPYWEAVIGILTTASTFYALILNKGNND